MNQNRNDDKLSKFISLVLRHNPAVAGITLDRYGWAEVSDLLTGIKQTGRNIDLETLERIVREDTKQRYSFSDNHSKIRANQGHSIAVDLELKEQNPPNILYHGTASRFLENIQREGLTRQQRQHVHLSADLETALSVGRRHGNPVVLDVAAARMVADGLTFWYSANGIWLCMAVPWQYLSVHS